MASHSTKPLRLSLIASALAVASLAVAQSMIPAPDRDFAEKAAMGGAAEVQSGRMAERKGMNSQVKQFGARMAQDHAKAATN